MSSHFFGPGLRAITARECGRKPPKTVSEPGQRKKQLTCNILV
jgi:hypothetical protein